MKKPTRRARPRPRHLPAKLLRIREAFQENQTEFAKRFPSHVKQKNISSFETGEREADLLALLHYAELANVCLDVLVSDDFDLPATIPAKEKRHNAKN
jgi:hypothetical protein